MFGIFAYGDAYEFRQLGGCLNGVVEVVLIQVIYCSKGV